MGHMIMDLKIGFSQWNCIECQNKGWQNSLRAELTEATLKLDTIHRVSFVFFKEKDRPLNQSFSLFFVCESSLKSTKIKD